LEPQSMSPGSIMPSYTWLFENKIDTAITPAKIRAMQTLGVPYATGFDLIANANLMAQAYKIQAGLKLAKLEVAADAEIIALIAYLQRVGTDIKGAKALPVSTK